jgi:hypothetical protein
MANKTINDWDALGTTPASGDFFAIWDLDAAAQKKVSYTNLLGFTVTGGGTIATGGFTLTVPATGTAALLEAANVFTASNRFGYDTDSTHYMGRAAIGYTGVTADNAAFGHLDVMSGTDYALRQSNLGVTRLNGSTGTTLYFAINNATQMELDTTGLGVGNIVPSYKLDVNGTSRISGAALFSSAITASSTITATGAISGAADTDTTNTLGRAAVGFTTGYSDSASFAHIDYNNSTDFALRQTAVGGVVHMNTPTGGSLHFRVNNVEQMRIDATRMTVTNGMRAAYDTDAASTFGRAAVGYNGAATDEASFAHLDSNSGTAYALKQTTAGETTLNGATGTTMYFRLNNATLMELDATGLGIGNVTPTTLLDVNGDSVRIRTSQSPSSGGTGIQGEIAWDASYIYVCTATNTWKRAALTGGY